MTFTELTAAQPCRIKIEAIAIVTDAFLTSYAWLKQPLEVPDNLTRKRIIAECYASLQPSESLWKKYLKEANRLLEKGEVSKESYYIITY